MAMEHAQAVELSFFPENYELNAGLSYLSLEVLHCYLRGRVGTRLNALSAQGY
jgi:hypothetical protein